MSKVQDDLDQTKYMFYRVITLLMVYTTPLYVGMWWVAEPFVSVVYGEKWMPVAQPLTILVMSGVFLNVLHPCAVLLDAQNRLNQEMVALIVRLIVTLATCLMGLQWGLIGVAWAILATHVFSASYYYVLVGRAIPTRTSELLRAIAPGMILNVLLFLVLAAAHFGFADVRASLPFVYLVVMGLVGAIAYIAAFLFLPLPAISDEAERWRRKIGDSLGLIFKART